MASTESRRWLSRVHWGWFVVAIAALAAIGLLLWSATGDEPQTLPNRPDVLGGSQEPAAPPEPAKPDDQARPDDRQTPP